MSKIKILFLLFVALALFAVSSQRVKGGENTAEGAPADDSTVTANYNIEYEKPPAEGTVLTPEEFQRFQEGNIPTLGTRGVKIKKSNYAKMSDNDLAEELAMKLWELAQISENMKARSAVGEFEVPIGTLEKIESLADRIKDASSTTMTNKIDRNLKHSVELAALRTQIAGAELSSKETQDRINGLHRELYGTFAPLTIKVRFNAVEQREEAVYMDGSPVRFKLVMIPGSYGGSIVSLQKDAKLGIYAPMSCNNISGCPLNADGSRIVTLTVGRERYPSSEEALKGLARDYKVQESKAFDLIREKAQYVVTAP